MKTWFLSIFFAAAAAFIPAARASESMDNALQKKIEALTAGFRGEVGIFVRHLESGLSAAVEADKIFPTASMIKVPITVAVFDKIERGELDLEQKLIYDPEAISYPYPGECLIASLRTGETVRLKKLVHLMLALSDNHASLWCQSLAGTGNRINELMAEMGFDQIKVNSRTDGRQPDWQKYGWGQTTPRQMAELLVTIRERRAVSPVACDSIYRFLSASAFHEDAISEIPPFVQAATKQGAVNQSRSEVVLVNAPSGDYVFCIATRNQEDQSWSEDNEGAVLIRNLSRTLWEHFEPDHPWQPASRTESSASGSE